MLDKTQKIHALANDELEMVALELTGGSRFKNGKFAVRSSKYGMPKQVQAVECFGMYIYCK